MGAADVIAWRGERARATPWRGDGRVALLTPAPDAPPPSADFLRRCVDALRSRGYDRVVTNALAPPEQAGFLAIGFGVVEQLHLLGRDLAHLPPAPPIRTRRARATDHGAVLSLDRQAFPPFWTLEQPGLRDALAATPRTRFRVVAGGVDEVTNSNVVGYSITGRSGRRGYVQRLAVHPAVRRRGTGRALVVDALRWLRRWRVEQVMVNTQLENTAALALYESLGFRKQPARLSVLRLDLPR